MSSSNADPPKNDDSTPNSNNTEAENVESEQPESSAGGLNLETIRKFFADKLGITDDKKTEKVKVLEEVSLNGVAAYIKSDTCKNIITMAGAGISTSAGIPDFRSPGTGLYRNLQKYNLPHPQAVFELEYFHQNPKPFFELAKDLYPGKFEPTTSHYFIKLLNDKGKLLRHYTQNIDTLEHIAGIPAEKLIEAHGTFRKGHCLECHKEYTQDWMKERIFKDEIPICEDCSGVVKPDIIFFGENLPEKFHKTLVSDFPKCDLLIVLGSSLVVQPFASLVDRVSETCPRLLINREKAGHRSGIMALMGLVGGMDFDSPDNTRDVAWLGDCDEGCQLLADLLEWGDELKELSGKKEETAGDNSKKSENSAVTSNKTEEVTLKKAEDSS